VYERQEEFRLFRDKVLLAIGSFGVMGVGFAAIAVGVKDSAVALAALTVFATLLGVPGFLRLDEKRKSGNGSTSPSSE
jgi:multisubunit Na+/H+ antiporter MnhB subunit